MKTFRPGDVVTVPDRVLLKGVLDRCNLSQEDIVIMQYRTPCGRLCTVASVNKHSVKVLVNFCVRHNFAGYAYYVDVPLDMLAHHSHDRTIKVSSLDYDSSDVLSDEDKLIIKGYMQTV